jgi:hypothetical protein
MRLKAVEAQARGDMNSYVSHPFLCSENQNEAADRGWDG